ncbi:hypothetical protein BB561_003884 [Smittium simulii]|uniref:Uncharacterized protein n=1 Tax=Smittium simulii TaxID=133385 RepID=A0A2T9YJ36_9FUNG|nr:hypothetical protein BB561_003884 [Smittium simulii]
MEKLELILNKSNPAVLCLQETHLSEKTSLLQLKGYICVESKKNLAKIGSELLIAAQNSSGWDISEQRSEYSWMADFELIGEKKEAHAVWANHFAQLAQTTSIKNSNFELFLFTRIDVFSECNITPTWNDITTALKSIPTSRRPKLWTTDAACVKDVQQATLQRIEELTEKVNQLLLARETVPAPITVPEPEDQFITTRAPANKLKIYPMLKEAPPLIDEGLFCIYLTEEKRKNAIYSCPRSSFINYLPPPLNDSALTAVKKADSTLHGIQVALAQATRPVDYYANRIIQDNPGITFDDPRFLFADTTRVLLFDIAATVTQERLDNLHRGMYLPEKPQQLVESEYGTQNSTSSYTAPAQTTEAAIPGSLENPSNFPVGGRLAMFKQTWEKLTDNQWIRNIDEKEDVSTQRAAALWVTAIDDAPTSVQAEAQSRGLPDPDGGSSIIANKESNRGKDRGTQTCSRLTETELSCRREKFQDGVSCLHMQTNQAKELHDVSRSRKRIYAHSYTQLLQEVSALLLERESIPIQSAPVWTVSQPAHFYQGAPPDNIMGKNTEHQNICIPGRHPNYWGVEKDMQEKYGPSIFQTDRAGIQNKVREVDKNAISVENPSWYGNQFTEHEPQSSFLKDLGPPPRSDKTIESWPDDVEMPGELYWKSPSYVGCPTPGSSNAETTLGTQEQVLIIDKDMDINCDTHRARQTEPVVLERPIGSLEWPIVSPGDPRTGTLYRCQIVESFGGVDAHQRQRTINDIIRTPAPECCWSFGISLLRQYHHSSIFKEVWWDDLPETARNCRRNMEPLHSDKHAPSGHIRLVVLNPADAPSRLTAQTEWSMSDQAFLKITELYGPHNVDLFASRTNTKLTHYYSWFPDSRAVEPDIPGSPESALRTSDNYFSNTAMENSNLVSGSTGIISCSATASTGNDGHTRPQKRKISTVEQQELVPYVMENQRRVLQAQYWHLTNNQSTSIQTSHIVNYLTHIFKTKKHSTNTIKSYKSAILNLVADPKTVDDLPCRLVLVPISTEKKPKLSCLSPLELTFPDCVKNKRVGDTSGLDNQKLTTKCCRLLSLCGFLRTSNIHRIDDARTIITKDTLKLVIIAPKEKRKGQPVERLCEINRYSNHILCPVLAYTVYKARIATELCPTPHANSDSIIVNRLFRHTKHYNKPLSVDSITRHVKNLSELIKRPPNTPISKTRAIGATLAAISGVSVENIVLHTFWSNYSIFNTYYRLDRSTQSNRLKQYYLWSNLI